MAKKRARLYIVTPEPSEETIRALEELLHDARHGYISGLVFAAMRPGAHDYIIGTTGEARRRPTYARGMIQAVDDDLRDVLKQRYA